MMSTGVTQKMTLREKKTGVEEKKVFAEKVAMREVKEGCGSERGSGSST